MKHPTKSELLGFAKQELSESSAETVLDHLSLCDGCARIVEELEKEQIQVLAGSAWISPEQMGPSDLLDETGFQRMRDAVIHPTSDVGRQSTPADDSVVGSIRRIPETIGPYRLRELIGEGGFGLVYKAEQTEPIYRPVAIKLIKPGRDTRRVIARFDAERQTLALMDHPNIAQVFDAGSTPDGHPYFVMELVDGTTITQHCVEKRVPLKERLRLVIDVCRAVQHAHQKGIIHRDIKPSNVLVSMKDRAVVKVIDFGVAKALHEPLLSTSAETRIEHVVGTPLYMSPEQAAGDGIDTRSDVYALGVVLYELLTGSTPFTTENQGADRAKILRAIIEEQPQRPSDRARKENPGSDVRTLQGDLDWIAIKALAKESERRYQSAADLAADLQRYLDGDTVLATPPTATYRLKKFAWKYRVPLTTAATVFVITIVGAAVATGQAIRARKAEFEAEKAAVRSENALRFLVDMFRSPNPTHKGRELTVASLLGEALDELLSNEIKQDLDPAAKAELLYAIGESFQGLGLMNESIRATNEAYEIRKTVLGLSHKDTLQALGNLAQSHLQAGDVKKCLELSQYAYEVVHSLSEPPENSLAGILSALGQAHHYSGAPDKAIPYLEQAMELHRKLATNGQGDVLDLRNELMAMSALGQVRFSKGDADVAAKLFIEAHERAEAAFGSEDPGTIMFLHNLAHVKMNTGKANEAIPMIKQCLEVSRKTNGEDHMETMLAMGNLAQAYYFTGDLKNAIVHTKEVLELMEEHLGHDHIHTLTSTYNLGRYLEMDGDLDSAVKYLERAKERRTEVLGELHPSTLLTCRSYGVVLVKHGKVDSAVEVLDAFLRLKEKAAGDAKAEYAAAIHRVASEMMEASEYRLASDYFARCVDVQSEYATSVVVAQTLSDLGGALFKDGQSEEAERRWLDAYSQIGSSTERTSEVEQLVEKIASQLVELYVFAGDEEKAAEWQRYISESEERSSNRSED